jgi:hypothetical protein
MIRIKNLLDQSIASAKLGHFEASRQVCLIHCDSATDRVMEHLESDFRETLVFYMALA